MAVVIGSASIRLTAVSDALKKDIGAAVNDAIGDIDSSNLDKLNAKLRQSELDLVKARQAVVRFNRETAAAERELAEARKDSASTPEKIAEAELKLARAQAEGNVAREKVKTITLSMTRAQEDYRRSTVAVREETVTLDKDTNRLHETMRGLHGITRGLGAAFSFVLPSMGQVSVGGRTLSAVLVGLTQVTAVALAGQAAFAGAGGLLAVASALSQAAGAALLLPAALGAGAIAIATLTVGLHGMGDALKSVGDPAKFAESLKDLSPNARAFAIAVRDMVPAFKELRLQVQDRLFAGLAKDLAEIGKIHLPVIQKGLSAMAVSLNEGAKGFAAFARDKRTVADLGTLFSNSALGAHFLSEAVQPLLSALRDIGTVGASFLPALADGFAGAAKQFATFIAQARESGRLKEIISGGLSALGDIFKILVNIGSILGSVLRAGQDAGVGFLATAKDITGELAAWAKSAAGQSAFVDFLSAAKQVAMALLPILGSVIELVAHQLAPILGMIATTVGPSVKIVIDALAVALAAAAPGIRVLAQGFANFLEALAPMLPAIGELVRVLGESLGQVLTALGPVIAEVGEALANELADVIPDLVPAIIAIAEALGDLLLALIPVIPSVVALLGPFTEAGGIIEALIPLVAILVDTFRQVVEMIAPLIPLLADSLIKILTDLIPVFEALSEVILKLTPGFVKLVEILLPVIELLSTIISAILPPIIELFSDFNLSGVDLANTISSLVAPAFLSFRDTVGSVIDAVIGWIVNLASKVLGLGRSVQDGLRNVALFFFQAFEAARGNVVDAFFRIADGIRRGIDNALAWVRGLPGRIGSALGDLGRLLFDAGLKLITGLLDGIKKGAQKVFDFMRTVGPSIASLKGPIDVDKKLLIPAGLAIMSGLHSSLVAGFDPVKEFMAKAGPELAAQFEVPGLTPGVPTARLPGVQLGSRPAASGGDGAATPTDVFTAVTAAIEGWQVVISARDAANKVNKVNRDNAGR